MSATTDSLGKIGYDYVHQPGVSNLLDLLALFTERPAGDVIKQYVGQTQYGPLKTAVSDAVAGFISSFQTRLEQVDEALVLKKLEQSEAAMRVQASKTLLKAQQAVGIRPSIHLGRT